MKLTSCGSLTDPPVPALLEATQAGRQRTLCGALQSGTHWESASWLDNAPAVMHTLQEVPAFSCCHTQSAERLMPCTSGSSWSPARKLAKGGRGSHHYQAAASTRGWHSASRRANSGSRGHCFQAAASIRGWNSASRLAKGGSGGCTAALHVRYTATNFKRLPERAAHARKRAGRIAASLCFWANCSACRHGHQMILMQLVAPLKKQPTGNAGGATSVRQTCNETACALQNRCWRTRCSPDAL